MDYFLYQFAVAELLIDEARSTLCQSVAIIDYFFEGNGDNIRTLLLLLQAFRQVAQRWVTGTAIRFVISTAVDLLGMLLASMTAHTPAIN